MKYRTLVVRMTGIAAILVIAAGLIGCGSAKLVNVWKNPEFTRTPLTSVLVVAMKKNPANRRIWEDTFAAELEKYGTAATPSYKLYPDAPPDTPQVMTAVKENNFDGVIVTMNLPNTFKTRYEPGYIGDIPGFGLGDDDWDGWDDWYGAYGFYYGTFYNPGYIETETIVRDRTDVWSTKGKGELVWSGTSEVFNPSSSQQVGDEIADKIVPDLSKQDIIPRR